ncbi:PXA domain protein [Aspergillus sp. HF37]|nr:PXA domain protein [Aspergillus sp. HF37]
MTSDPPRPGLQPLSHLKAGPTTSRSRSTARPAASNAQQTPRSPNRSPLRKNFGRKGLDPTSERVTTALIRRVLCPQGSNYGTSASQPPEELLPPLTSSNDVDHQLYAFIAVIVREFVYSWYSGITSDQALVNEALQMTAHCARALEQRLRHVDVAQLLLDEIPSLVETHITSYRLAKQQPNLSGLAPSTRTVYHTLNPHPALSPAPIPSDPQTTAQQGENEAIYRQLLMHGTLAVLLPTEDLENACLRTLVGDLLADRLMGDEVSQRICEGWFLWDTLSKLLDAAREHMDRETEAIRGYQQERLAEVGSLSTHEEQNGNASFKPQSSVSAWFSSFLHAAYLAYVALCFVAIGLFRVASRPSPSRPKAAPTSQRNESPKSAGNVTGKRAVLDYRLYSMVSQLLDVPRRKPWLTGTLALMQHMIVAGPGRIGDTDSVLDR